MTVAYAAYEYRVGFQVRTERGTERRHIYCEDEQQMERAVRRVRLQCPWSEVVVLRRAVGQWANVTPPAP